MSNLTTPTRTQASRAFTLIELMIVITIVGILSMLGVVGYRKLILGAHTSEATRMVQAIKVGEELYHAENHAYLGTASLATVTSSFWPNAAPANIYSPWSGATGTCTAPCTGACSACWGLLPVHADGDVLYGYSTAVGSAGTSPGSVTLTGPAQTLTGPSGTSSTDWYWVVAMGNPANYATGGPYSWVVGNSFTQELYVIDQ